ncbi:VOC family protein [Cognatishimia activa]|uniref:VOC family protein n=1 Tax=Cognatishimia activa TaxID=1715691 RepID=UPI0022301EE2|nr:VOC family protein [Cognatishimia activa]UZD92083.1 VOC family protein [Cognatishimia activa]
MIDHFGINVSDFERSKAFYEHCLKPLGHSFVFRVPLEQTGGVKVGGFGKDRAGFWINECNVKPQPLHFAFSAENRAQVDAFYEAALVAGGSDNGGPGLRTHYHAHYYGAFVLDPDGNNIEAVCHKAP